MKLPLQITIVLSNPPRGVPEAFDRVRQRLQDFARHRRGDTKLHEA